MGRPNSPHNNRPFNSWSREGKPFSRSDKEQGWLSKREDAVTNNLHFAPRWWLENEMNTGEHRNLGRRGPEAPAPFFFLHPLPSAAAEPHISYFLNTSDNKVNTCPLVLTIPNSTPMASEAIATVRV